MQSKSFRNFSQVIVENLDFNDVDIEKQIDYLVNLLVKEKLEENFINFEGLTDTLSNFLIDDYNINTTIEDYFKFVVLNEFSISDYLGILLSATDIEIYPIQYQYLQLKVFNKICEKLKKKGCDQL